MSVAAQPLPTEDSALSPWWLRTVLIVMVLGFTGLIVSLHWPTATFRRSRHRCLG